MNVLMVVIPAHLAQSVRTLKAAITVIVQQGTVKVLGLFAIPHIFIVPSSLPDGCVFRKQPYPNNSVRTRESKKCTECTCNVSATYDFVHVTSRVYICYVCSVCICSVCLSVCMYVCMSVCLYVYL